MTERMYGQHNVEKYASVKGVGVHEYKEVPPYDIPERGNAYIDMSNDICRKDDEVVKRFTKNVRNFLGN